MRIAMQSKQATHTMPVKRHTPLLVGSGAEKSLASAVGNTSAYKARTDGKVVEIDTKHQLVKLEYDDGEIAYIDMSPRSIKNSGGGFFITVTHELSPDVGLHRRFKAGDILTYDPAYFSPNADGSTAYKTGVLVKIALAALDRFKAQRVTAIYRLDLIAKGAVISYEDGTPVDMASEKARLEQMVADMDRRIAQLERTLG